MLMRNPEYRFQHPYEREFAADKSCVAPTPREMLLGQFVLLLLFVIAILLRSTT